MLLRDADVAKRLNVSRRQIWKLLASRQLPMPIRFGRSVRWREADIQEWIQAGCPAGWTPTAGKAVCA
jgi:excisionase family DNA binding protein